MPRTLTTIDKNMSEWGPSAEPKWCEVEQSVYDSWAHGRYTSTKHGIRRYFVDTNRLSELQLMSQKTGKWTGPRVKKSDDDVLVETDEIERDIDRLVQMETIDMPL